MKDEILDFLKELNSGKEVVCILCKKGTMRKVHGFARCTYCGEVCEEQKNVEVK